MLLIDVDSYDAITYALSSLYEKVEPGGAIIIDDYNYYAVARDAVNDFLWENNVVVDMFSSDKEGRVIWFKE